MAVTGNKVGGKEEQAVLENLVENKVQHQHRPKMNQVIQRAEFATAPLQQKNKIPKTINEYWYWFKNRLIQIIIDRSSTCKGNFPFF